MSRKKHFRGARLWVVAELCPLHQIALECAPNGGHLAGMELTRAAGLSEDESHGQTTFP
jgi:hypothetical protein